MQRSINVCGPTLFILHRCFLHKKQNIAPKEKKQSYTGIRTSTCGAVKVKKSLEVGFLVKILITYCKMSRPFHVLPEVPLDSETWRWFKRYSKIPRNDIQKRPLIDLRILTSGCCILTFFFHVLDLLYDNIKHRAASKTPGLRELPRDYWSLVFLHLQISLRIQIMWIMVLKCLHCK